MDQNRRERASGWNNFKSLFGLGSTKLDREK